MALGLLLTSGPAWGAGAVLFAEEFEAGTLDRWDAGSVRDEPSRLRLTTDPAHVFRGRFALEVTAHPGRGTGAHLDKSLLPGYERIHVQWVCKFAADFDQGNLMHLVWLRGTRPEDPAAAFGKAGVKPSGADFFATWLDPWRDWGRNPPPGELVFYTYYPDMTRARDGRYWGNPFRPLHPVLLQPERWYRVEMMVRLNAPGEADGEQAFWVDGDLKGRWTGIRWRTTDALKITGFSLALYIHDSPRVNRVWFDDVSVSLDYIGLLPEDSPSR